MRRARGSALRQAGSNGLAKSLQGNLIDNAVKFSARATPPIVSIRTG
jgi:hypothetical protein